MSVCMIPKGVKYLYLRHLQSQVCRDVCLLLEISISMNASPRIQVCKHV